MDWFCHACSPDDENECEPKESKLTLFDSECKDCHYYIDAQCCICETATRYICHLEEKLSDAEFTARILSTIMITVSIVIAFVGVGILAWSRIIR